MDMRTKQKALTSMETKRMRQVLHVNDAAACMASGPQQT
jgi:hypothetical protein